MTSKFSCVYPVAQRQLRLALYESHLKIKNQLGKPTDSPTLKWIFQCFQSIHVVEFNNNQKQVSNWNEERDFILKLLPNHCLSYYSFITSHIPHPSCHKFIGTKRMNNN